MEKTFCALILALLFLGINCRTFTVSNNCPYTVWAGVLTSPNSPPLAQTGFELAHGASISFEAPEKWSGRLWGRTHCSNKGGTFSCLSGNCGPQVPCHGAGGVPPATLIEFTLNGDSNNDFYDTSLVDGFNLPFSVAPQGGKGGNSCKVSGCPADINAICPPELRLQGDGVTVGCKSACLVFNTDEYCCRGAYGTPDKCKPNKYSKLFKKACPLAYSYAYDDATSTFTCVGANYSLTFCP